jgi:trehalose-6-phosphate synthase
VEELRDQPCEKTAVLLERWRGRPDVGHLEKLAAMELLIADQAGAAQELRDAILVNPYDTEGFAAAIDRALSMPLDERKARQKSLYQAVRASDQRGWAGKFLSRLNAPARNSGGVRVVAAT